MRIIELSFTNINNLKGGPHIISFEQEPLSTAGLFAIIGPTGSGKSTLLDVITLALFNQIPRFGKAISKTELNSLGSVITHHTDHAEAKIRYEVNNEQYTSTWSISKNRNGKLKDYEMSISNRLGEYLDLKKSEVPNKNQELIGLKYKQFLKSIILSQGEFSKFLKSDKNERGQLLENLTGTSIYRKLGKAAYEKVRQLDAQITQKSESLNQVLLLSEEEKIQIVKDLATADTEKIKLDKSIAELRTLARVKQEISKANEGISQKEQQQQQLTIKLTAFEPRKEQLDIHERLNPIREPLTLYKQAETNAQETRKNLELYKSALSGAETNLTSAIKEMSTLTKQVVTAENFSPVMSTFEKKVNALDEELKHIASKGKDIRERINDQLLTHSIQLSRSVKPSEAIQFLNTEKAKLLLQLSSSAIAPDSDPAILNESIASLRESEQHLRQYIILDQQLSKLAKETSDLNSLETSDQTQVTKLIPLLEKSKELVKSLLTIETTLLKAKDDAFKIASLEEQRNQLISGKACPLCGSFEHPYSMHIEQEQQSAIEDKIQANKLSIEQERAEIATLNDNIVKLKSSLAMASDRKQKLKREKEALKAEISALQKQWKGSPTDLEGDLDQTLVIQTQKLQQQERAVKALSLLTINTDLEQLYNQLNQVLAEHKVKQDQRTQHYVGDNLSYDCNRIQYAFQDAKTSKVENQKAYDIEAKDLIRANDMLDNASKTIQPKLLELGFSTIVELEQQILSEDQYQKYNAQQLELTRQQTSIITELDSLKKSLNENLALDTQPEVVTETIKVSLFQQENRRDNLNTTIGSNKQKLEQDKAQRENQGELRKHITQLQKELEKWSLLKQFIGDATGNSFANFAQGLTLQNLIVFTNKRLTGLTDRYLLDKPKDDGLLQVVDKYQGNILRAVSTLSGGETFLISLALALSLSDMASKNVTLESLFIDEGFGTLDQETLDIALDSLERLQSESQKTVGVISHVEALKERINVQIKLEKNAQGYSTISIES